MDEKILNQVPQDYYYSGIKTNIFQWIWHSLKWRSLKEYLGDLDGSILDVGCADGNLTSRIAEFLPGAKLTGLDVYKKAINFAAKKWPNIKFVCADARQMPFGKGSFAAAICVETLEHIPDNIKAVKEINRVLKRGGYFVVCQDTDNFLFNLVWSFWIRWKGKVWNGAHVSCLKPKELKKLLKKNGFKIIGEKFSHFGMEVTIKAQKV